MKPSKLPKRRREKQNNRHKTKIYFKRDQRHFAGMLYENRTAEELISSGINKTETKGEKRR